MKDLTVINHNGVNVIDSREVAEMTGKRHADLLDSISGYTKHLTNGKFRSMDFFIPSTYIDAKGETRPQYLVTRKGCDMIANKMTGEKGVLFTAAYVSKFHEMEQGLNSDIVLPRTYLEALKALVSSEEEKQLALAELDRSKEWYSIKRVAAINGVSYKIFDWRKLKDESQRLGLGPKKIFDANYGEVNTYHSSVWETLYPRFEL